MYLDRTLFYSLATSLMKLITGPLTLILIAKFLNPIEQGFYFTFFSILATTQLIEAGFGFVCGQFISHRCSKVKFHHKNIYGNKVDVFYIKEKISLLFFWQMMIFLFIFIIVYNIGIYIYSDYRGSVNWEIPWILFLTFNIMNYIGGCFSLVLESLQQREFAFKARLISNIITSVVFYICIYNRLGLYSIALGALFGGSTLTFLCIRHAKFIIFDSIKYFLSTKFYLNFKANFKEVIPLFSRISLTWITGYFFWNSINLISFKVIGPEFSGKIGLTISMLRAGMSICDSGMNSKKMRISYLISIKDFITSQRIFFRIISLFLIILIFGYLLGIFLLNLIPSEYADRFLPTTFIFELMIAYIFLYITTNLAMYMRSFKKEPMLFCSLFQNIIFPIGAFLTLYYISIDSFFLFFIFLNFICMIWAIFIAKDYFLNPEKFLEN